MQKEILVETDSIARKELLNHYDAILYINMDSSTDRRKHIEDQLKDADVPVVRIAAVTPNEQDAIGFDLQKILHLNAGMSDTFENKPWRITEANNRTRLIESCCAASHAKAMLIAYNMGYRNILILEDDAVIVNDLKTVNNFITIREEIPENAVLTYLAYTVFDTNPGTFLLSKGYHLNFKRQSPTYARVHSGMMSTAAYSINLGNLTEPQLLEITKELMLGSIADLFLSMFVQKQYPCYCTLSKPIEPSDAIESTIDSSAGYNAIIEASRVDIFKNKLDTGFYYDCANMYPERDANSPEEYVAICKYVNPRWERRVYPTSEHNIAMATAHKHMEVFGDEIEEFFLIHYRKGNNIGTKYKIFS